MNLKNNTLKTKFPNDIKHCRSKGNSPLSIFFFFFLEWKTHILSTSY